MKLSRELKKDSRLLLVVVLILTILTLSLSYSAVFSVDSASKIQKIETGTLSVVIDNVSSPIYDDLLPTPDEKLPTAVDSIVDSKYSLINFTNNGDYNTEFALTLGRDFENLPSLTTDADLLPLNFLNVGVHDGTGWVNFGTPESPAYYTALSDLTLVQGKTDTYTILTDTLNIDQNKEYRVYVWLANTTPTEHIGKLVYLKLDLDYAISKSETMTSEEIALLNNN